MAAQTDRIVAATDSPRKIMNKSSVKSIVPLAEECPYTQFYCEENIWHLCDHVRRLETTELTKCHVVFISNNQKCVPLWRQRSGKSEDKLVTWDYHVIFMYEQDDRCLVFDLDSDLPFPTYFHKYVTETLRTDQILKPEHHRFFRVIPASVFLQKFASDRRHMRKQDGSFLQKPPPHPPIKTAECVHNLEMFISMDSKIGCGTVYNLQDYVRRFYKTQ